MNEFGKNVYDNLELLPPDFSGWNSDSFIFKMLIEKTSPSVIIEVGTWKGLSALHMADICKSSSLNSKIYCVDTWLGALEFWTNLRNTTERNLILKNGYPSIYYQFLSNVIHRNHQDIIVPVPNTSYLASKIFKHFNIQADLIYIDGSHEYDDVKSDIINYYELLKPNGIMFGDDYNTQWQGVIQAVDEFCNEKNISKQIYDNNFWRITK